MSEISDVQILQALEDKAKLYRKLADDFKKALNGAAPSISHPAPKVTLEAIRAYLKEKGARPRDLANHFNCSIEEIHVLTVDPSSGIQFLDRGWLKLEEEKPLDG